MSVRRKNRIDLTCDLGGFILGTAIGVFVLWVMFGCSSTKYIPIEGDTRIETHYKERIDTVSIYVPVPAQSSSKITPEAVSYLETDVAGSNAWIDSIGLLHHNIFNKRTSLPANIPVKSFTRDSVVYRDRAVPYPVEKALTQWEQTKMDFGGMAIGGTAIALCVAVMWLIKKFRR